MVPMGDAREPPPTAPIRVAHLGKFYPPARGGIERVLATLCADDSGAFDSSVLVMNTSRNTRTERVGRVKVTRVGVAASAGSVPLAPSLPFKLSGIRADVIVLHEPNPMALLAYALARPRCSLVVWYHSEVIRPRWRYRLFYEPFLEFVLRRAARIVVASPPMLDVPALAGHRAKCVTIPYGLEAKAYDATPEVLVMARGLRAQISRPVLLFVGRLVQYKGVDRLLRAASSLEADVVIVGDGPVRRELEALAKRLGMADRTRFVGDASETQLVAWYYASDVVVLPSISRQEAFGMVQVEAMLCSRPVVSTSVETGVPWVNRHGETGLCVSPGDTTELHSALGRLLNDPDLRHRLGVAGRARAKREFSAERMRRAAAEVYRKTAGGVL